MYFACIDRVTIANEKASGQWEKNGLTLPVLQCHTAPAGTVFPQRSHSLKTKSQIIILNMTLSFWLKKKAVSLFSLLIFEQVKEGGKSMLISDQVKEGCKFLLFISHQTHSILVLFTSNQMKKKVNRFLFISDQGKRNESCHKDADVHQLHPQPTGGFHYRNTSATQCKWLRGLVNTTK